MLDPIDFDSPLRDHMAWFQTLQDEARTRMHSLQRLQGSARKHKLDGILKMISVNLVKSRSELE